MRPVVLTTLLVCFAGACGVGAFACCLWRKSLQLARHRLYVESAVRVVEAAMRQQSRGRNLATPRP